MTEKRLESGGKYYTSSFKADILNIKRTINETLAYYEKTFSMMDESSRLEMKVVLNELLVNAFKHGGKNGARSFIKAIAGMASEDCAFLIIEDDGEGYDTSRIKMNRSRDAYPSRVDDIEETGRGIFIVRSLCEDFMVNEKGNKVVVIKKMNKTA
jgi:serine/threonine-protein kinase RsbW